MTVAGFRAHWLAVLVLATLVHVATTAASSAGTTLAPLIARVLSYDRSLAKRSGASVNILVVHAKDSKEGLRESEILVGAFNKLSGTTIQGLPLRAKTVVFDPPTLDRAIAEGGDVVIVCSGLERQLEAVTKLTRTKKVLSLGLRRDHAVAATSLAVILEAGRPKIIANLSHAKAEGVQLSAQLLRRAEVL